MPALVRLSDQARAVRVGRAVLYLAPQDILLHFIVHGVQDRPGLPPSLGPGLSPSAWAAGAVQALCCGNGLICIRGRERDRDGFISRCAMCVFNPLTKACKELPQLDLQPELPWTVKLEVDRTSSSGGFRVFVVCTTEENSFYHFWVLCVYSSETDCWTITQCEPIPADTLKQNPRADFVVCNGVLYRYGAGSLLLHRMNDQSFEWHAGARVPAVNELDSQFYLLEYNGSVHFVGQVWHGDILTYGIWKLDTMSTVWVQVSLLPEEMLEKLGGSHRGRSSGSLASFCTILLSPVTSSALWSKWSTPSSELIWWHSASWKVRGRYFCAMSPLIPSSLIHTGLWSPC